MGKKNRDSSAQLDPSTLATVSIVTVTQLSRSESLKILYELVSDQDYKNIVEWVIVEGSHSEQDRLKNGEYIKVLVKESKLYFPINYVVPPLGTKLGGMRNTGNKSCKGDITVCMDDDDYYPPTRVSYAVETLVKHPDKNIIAGSTKKRIYDYTLDKFYEFGDKFGPNHSTNDCMAWKKGYLIKNSHDQTKAMGEEASFTNNFTNAMVQLDCKKVLIGTVHYGNTFNKREMCIQASIGIHPNMYEIKEPVTNYMPKKYYSRFKKLYCAPPSKSAYDICYFTGITSIQWDPEDTSLGGSEQAIVHLSSEWAKQGKRVAVYSLTPEKRFNGVDYISGHKFPYESEHSVVILWRMSGVRGFEPFRNIVKAEKILLDLHDTFYDEYWSSIENCLPKVDLILFKSNFHCESFEKKYKTKLDQTKYVVIPNGIRKDNFATNSNSLKREPYRFCYCSCYTRGLMELLAYTWPIIFKSEPRSELHIYYGMFNIPDQEYKKAMTILLGQPGVIDHARQPMDVIIDEKWKSTFHLYITNNPMEIDCISVRESVATGCIPLISNYGVFSERTGIHFKMPEKPLQGHYESYGKQIAGLMKNYELIKKYRAETLTKEVFLDWNDISKKWTNLF